MFKKITTEISFKILILFIFWKLLKRNKNIEKYSKETQFSVYRSLMCFHFTFMSLENTLNFFKDGFKDIFYYKNKKINNLNYWFCAYILFDIIMMIKMKNKRVDLYFHHFLCVIAFTISISNNTFGYFSNIILIAEAMSLVSGIDKMFLEDKQMKKSTYCKKYRLFIIRYFRLPIWLISIITTLYHSHSIPRSCWWLNLSTSLIMIGLDRFWENKCLRAISKYEKNYSKNKKKMRSKNAKNLNLYNGTS